MRRHTTITETAKTIVYLLKYGIMCFIWTSDLSKTSIFIIKMAVDKSKVQDMAGNGVNTVKGS